MKSDQNIIVPVVIDTNVLVPSMYRETHLYNFILEDHLVLIWNDYIYCEARRIAQNMYYKHYQRFMDISNLYDVLEMIDIIFYKNNEVEEMPENWPRYSPDRNDDPFLFAAEQGGAEFIVSEDKTDMLSLGSFKGIPIGTPEEFFKWAKKNRPL